MGRRWRQVSALFCTFASNRMLFEEVFWPKSAMVKTCGNTSSAGESSLSLTGGRDDDAQFCRCDQEFE